MSGKPSIYDSITSNYWRRPFISAETKQMYYLKLNHHREATHSNLERFTNEKFRKCVDIIKPGRGEPMGMLLVATGPHAVVPGVVVKEITIGGPVHKSGMVKIGDQIVKVNGASLIGMKFEEMVRLIRGVSKGKKVQLEIIDGCGQIIAFRRQIPNPCEKLVLGNIILFLDPKYIMTISIQKKEEQLLGITLSPMGNDAVIPSVFISALAIGGAVRESRKLQLGDQILKVNGKSTVGLPLHTIDNLISSCSKGNEIQFKIARIKKMTSHNIYSDSHGIDLSSGFVTRVDPKEEAYKAGIKPGMQIMEIDEESYYGKDDYEIRDRLGYVGSKTVICMSPIDPKEESKDLQQQPQPTQENLEYI